MWQAILHDGQLEQAVSLGPGEGGRWSKDGSQVAFRSTRDGTPDIYTVAAGGGMPTRITNTPRTESWPDWLGDRLTFGRNPGGRDIWMARVGDILRAAGNQQ